MSDRLLTLMQLAKQWGWTRSKLWRLVAAGEIPHIRVGVRRTVYFRERDLEQWLAARTVGTKAKPMPAPRPAQTQSFAEEFGVSPEDAEAFL
jgi:excisionase family DNA binding protein